MAAAIVAPAAWVSCIVHAQAAPEHGSHSVHSMKPLVAHLHACLDGHHAYKMALAFNGTEGMGSEGTGYQSFLHKWNTPLLLPVRDPIAVAANHKRHTCAHSRPTSDHRGCRNTQSPCTRKGAFTPGHFALRAQQVLPG